MLERFFGNCEGGFFGSGLVDNNIILLILSIPRLLGRYRYLCMDTILDITINRVLHVVALMV